VSVHHCPNCDGWEHRGQRLVALGNGNVAVELVSWLAVQVESRGLIL
jgi:thioredoxin reductase